jgi:hypothetical protein
MNFPEGAEFKDVGNIAAHILGLKRDKQGLFRTLTGKKTSHGLARFFMGLVFVYYKSALVKMAAKDDLPLDLNELTIDKIMQYVEPRYDKD